MSENTVFNEFIVWGAAICAEKRSDFEAALLQVAESHNPSARLDIDTPSSIARITFWRSGDFHAEIIDIDSERTVYSSLGTMGEGVFKAALFGDFFHALRKR